MRPDALQASRVLGLTLFELLVVVAIAGLIAGLGTPFYMAWRADSRHAEAIAVVERELAVARSDAKRRGVGVRIILVDDATAIAIEHGDGMRDRSLVLPHGGSLTVAGGPVELSYVGAAAVQAPFAPVVFDVTTGAGAWVRSSRMTVIPPLGILGVRRVDG